MCESHTIFEKDDDTLIEAMQAQEVKKSDKER